MDIYEIIGNLLAAILVGLFAYLTPRAKAWLEARTDEATEASLQRMIRAFVRAAEQLFPEAGSGEIRKAFVEEQLHTAGVLLTEAVLNMIEGAVWEVNTENKKNLENQ